MHLLLLNPKRIFVPVRLLALTLFLVCGVRGSAQQDVLRFAGTVASWEEDTALRNATITAMDTADASRTFEVRCDGRGRGRLKLPLDRGYRITFSADGHVPKHVIMNLTGPGIKQRKWGYDVRLKLVLMPRLDGIDYAVCDRPMSLAHFAKGPNVFEWDERYTGELDPYLETMQNAYLDAKTKRRTP